MNRSDDKRPTSNREINMKLAIWIAGAVLATTVTALGGRKIYRRRQEKKILAANSES